MTHTDMILNINIYLKKKYIYIYIYSERERERERERGNVTDHNLWNFKLIKTYNETSTSTDLNKGNMQLKFSLML